LKSISKISITYHLILLKSFYSNAISIDSRNVKLSDHIRLLFLFALFFNSFYLNSQGNWLKSYGGVFQDEALDICENQSSGFYVGGYFSANGIFDDFNISGNGSTDAFIQSINEIGETQWVQSFGGSQSDRIVSLSPFPSGGLVALGYYTSEISLGADNFTTVQDSIQIFVTRLNAQGNILWSRECGGDYTEIPEDIDVDENGNIYITGQFKGSANFGSTNLVSTPYYNSSNFSFDVFLSKLDSNGNFLWTIQGSSDNDISGTAVACENPSEIYLAAQISDTVTFNSTFENQALNVGAILKFNGSGNETWLLPLLGGSVLPRDIQLSNTHEPRILGDLTGSLSVGTSNIVLDSQYQFNTFILDIDQEGNFSNISSYGSDNLLAGSSLVIGAMDESYITGTFRCKFTEPNMQLGDGLFKSMGFNDVWLARIDADGTKNWIWHYAGPRHDQAFGIAYKEENRPLVTGSYSGYFHAPSNENFLDVSTSDIDNLFVSPNIPPNFNFSLCGIQDYGNWKTLKSLGPSDFSRDIFIADAIDPNLGFIYYYYALDYTDCEFEEYSLFIQEDTIESCGPPIQIVHQAPSGIEGVFGPEFIYTWNNGVDINQQIVTESGLYICEASRLDGCDVESIDSVQVIFYEPPAIPSISDELMINVEAIDDVQSIELCADSVILWAGNICDNCSFSWSLNGVSSTNDTVVAIGSGPHTISVLDSVGCSASNTVPILLGDTLDIVQDSLVFNITHNSMLVNGDTIILCPGEQFGLGLEGGGNVCDFESIEKFTHAEVIIGQDTSFSELFLSPNWSDLPIPDQIGWHYYALEPFAVQSNICIDTTYSWPQLIDSVYIDFFQSPFFDPQYTLSDNFLCPEDTALLVLSGADTYQVTPISGITEISEDSILVHATGDFVIQFSSVSSDGCEEFLLVSFSIQSEPSPLAWSLPENGIICPNDSVLISCEEGISYQWVDPFGNFIDTTQSFYTSLPGAYYCIHENAEGCVLASNSVEIIEYTSPFLISELNDLCLVGSVNLEVYSNEGAIIQWQPPVDSNSSFITVSEPGIYNVSSTLCSITTEMSIEIFDSLIDVEIEFSEDTLCSDNDAVLLSGPTGDFLYEWQPLNIFSQQIEVNEPGWYELIVYNQIGCSKTDSIEIFQVDNLAPEVESTEVCLGESVSLSAISNQEVFWSFSASGVPIIELGNTIQFENIQEDLLIYAFSGNENCHSSGAQVSVSVIPYSQIPEIETTSITCAGANIELSSNQYPDVQYIWTLPNDSIVNAPYLNLDSATIEYSGFYQLQIIGTECSSPIDSIELVISPPIESSILSIPDNLLCEGELLILNPEYMDLENLVWNGPQVDSQTNLPSIILDSVEVSMSGIYSFQGSNLDGCTAIGETIVQIFPYPQVSLDSAAILCNDGILSLSVAPYYDSYEWSNGESGSSVLVDQVGLWEIEVGIANLCFVQDSIYLPSTFCLEEMINVISPNGDGKNDNVNFGALGADVREVIIYNRWGNEIRRLSSSLVWDGTNANGKMVSEGVYYWVAVRKNNDQVLLNDHGYIHVFN